MITLKNQLVLQFSIGPFTDFISVEDFKGMEIYEHAGGLRPVLLLTFILRNKDILPYLNQGNIVSLRHGVKDLSTDSMQFSITATSDAKLFEVGSEISIRAAYYNPGFTNFEKSTVYKGKSFDVLSQICATNRLKFNTNVTNSNDLQEWSQDGRTDWTMSSFVADRAFKDLDTFFAYAFDCNNFYFYDVNKLLQAGPKWTLTCYTVGADENSSVVNIPTYMPDDSAQGQLSNLIGKNVETIGYNFDSGEFSYPKHKLKTFTTLGTNNLNINAQGCKSYNFMYTTGEEHANSLQAVNQNRRNLILFSSYAVRVPVPGQYRDFRLLDPVKLIPGQKDNEAEGFYFITGIVRQFADNMYRTNLTLNRESANGIKGDLVQGEK